MKTVTSNGQRPRLLNVNRRSLGEKSSTRQQPAIEADVPPLSRDDEQSLASFRSQQQVLRDFTLGCVDGHHTGAHFDGPPGVGKSHVILNRLREQRAEFHHFQRITAKPLFNELAKHPSGIFVIEDCEQFFAERSALTLIRSALGGEDVHGRRERRVTFSVSGPNPRVLETYFYGAIIFTSNCPLEHGKPEIRGVMSRVPNMALNPSEHEIRALLRHLARKGYVSKVGQMSPAECVEVIEHLINLVSELAGHLDLRWIGHAYGYYLTQHASGGTTDWRDMLKFHVMKTISYFDNTPPNTCSQDQAIVDDNGQLHREIIIAQEIQKLPGLTREDRLRLWQERTKEFHSSTGLSRPTYFRRLATGRAKQIAS